MVRRPVPEVVIPMSTSIDLGDGNMVIFSGEIDKCQMDSFAQQWRDSREQLRRRLQRSMMELLIDGRTTVGDETITALE